jgi:hypothetical protein
LRDGIPVSDRDWATLQKLLAWPPQTQVACCSLRRFRSWSVSRKPLLSACRGLFGIGV